jgi:hypothetical protein
MEVSPDTLQVMITEGLTEDAVSARIHKGGPRGLLLLSPCPAHSSMLTCIRFFLPLSAAPISPSWPRGG